MVARTYVLDAGVVIAFQRARQISLLEQIGARVPLVIVEEVRDELLNVPPKHEQRASEVQDGLLTPQRVRVESIVATDPAAAVLRELRRGRTTSSDLGEAASIAWVSDRPDTCLVLRDSHAAMLALEELRGRVLGLFGFLMELVDAGVVERAAAKAAGAAIVAAPDVVARLPTWWAPAL